MTEMTDYIKRLVYSQDRARELSRASPDDSMAQMRTKISDIYEESTSVVGPANSPAPTTSVALAQALAAEAIKDALNIENPPAQTVDISKQIKPPTQTVSILNEKESHAADTAMQDSVEASTTNPESPSYKPYQDKPTEK
jgi:hypothetical protein